MAAYVSGSFCHVGYGEEGRWSFWGETCIPKGYAEKYWPTAFQVLDYIDDRAICLRMSSSSANAPESDPPIFQCGDANLIRVNAPQSPRFGLVLRPLSFKE